MKKINRCSAVALISFLCIYLDILLFERICVGSFSTELHGIHLIHAVFYYYAPKISISIIICSLAFVFNAKVMFGIVCSISIWSFSNYIYYQANGMFIDAESLMLIGNLSDMSVLKSISPYLPGGTIFLLIPGLFLLLKLFKDKLGGVKGM